MADVEDLSVSLRVFDQGEHRGDDIPNPGKGAALGAIAIDRDRPAGKRATDKPWYHHSVLASLAGSDRVEESDDDGGQPLLLEISSGQELINDLRRGVAPPGP